MPLDINDSAIQYIHSTRLNLLDEWSCSVADLVLIAEWTTDEGPWMEDYFMVFVTIENGEAFFSKSPAAGGEIVLEHLSKLFGTPMTLELASGAQWNSRIIWPPALAGQQYFTFEPVTSGNLLARFWAKLLRQQEYRISDIVWKHVEQTRNGGPRVFRPDV